MSVGTESDLASSAFYCELCDFAQFCSYAEFHIHHLTHVRQPLVRLVKINSNLSAKLKNKSYKVNTGVARRSNNFEHVPPLKISVVNQQGLKQFQVVKKEINSFENYSVPETGKGAGGCDKRNLFDESTKSSEVEGNNLLERFGANISVSRRGKALSQVLAKSGPDHTGNDYGNLKKDVESINVNVDLESGNFLEKLSGFGGISIAPKPRSSINDNSDLNLVSDISLSSKVKKININQLKLLKDNKKEKKTLDKNKLLEKLNESGSITVATKSKSGSLAEVDKCEDKDGGSEEVKEQHKISNKIIRSKSENSNNGIFYKNCGDDQVQSGEDEVENGLNENGLEISEQKRFVRVKKSAYAKKNIRLEKQISSDESFSEERLEREELKGTDNAPKETGIDILERLTENLNKTVGGKKSAIVEKTESPNSKTMEEPLLSSCVVGGQQRLELPSPANQSECNNAAEGEDHYVSETKSQESSCPLLLTPPSSSGQDGESSNYNNTSISHQSETFSEVNNISGRNREVDNTVPFDSLNNENLSREQGESQNPFWSDLRSGSSDVNQSQQDPIMTPENSVPNGEDTLNSNFLHNFLSDHSTSNSIPPENSEFMSLDRLAQTQHPSSSYDLSNGDPTSPMEQLSQQVQRISNQSPQINVISQHHMQAPQPPQLHTGVPLSPQHISPQQPNSYDALSHMQPPMPPPLYQGFNLFNQNFSPQTPQQLPRPPLLQQRPQIQARNFQSLAAPSRQRTRGPKRNVVRLPASHEIPPPKQARRFDSPLQARPQSQNSTAKLPSGITVTPPKNTAEANKVANVLASRGITVTPAVSRQANQGNQAPKSQSRNTGQSPILNIGSGISITSSSQNRSSGGFAVPGPKRNTPIVNHHVDRPERCTTVDLTQDDEPSQVSRNKTSLGKFPCKQCGKIFTSSFTLESHKASHRAMSALPYKCDKCTAQYTTSSHLQQHKLNFHKTKQSAPDLAIPIVDLNYPGAREQLLKCGVYNFIPLAQLQSNNNGYFGMPIIQLDTAKEKAVSNLNSLGAANIFVLGKMKALVPQPNQ